MTMHQAQTAAPEGHTAGPWEIDEEHDPLVILGRPTWPCTHLGMRGVWEIGRAEELFDHPKEALANAKFIVRACNSHDELVEALRTVCAILDDYRAPGDELPAFEDPCELVNELEKRCVHEAITAAIASATGAA